MTRLWRVLAVPAGLLVATSAAAQVDEGLIVEPAIPQDYSRGRNVSVLEQTRQDFYALGIPVVGGFRFYPRVEAGAGGTSNTYLSTNNPIASPYAYLQGSARLNSKWSVHSLQFTGSVTQRDYIGQSPRNENLWNFDALGRLDVYHSIKVEADLNASRNVEDFFSGEVTPTVAALSHYRRNFGSVQATYTEGRTRTFVLLDHADLSFARLPLLTGGTLDQGDRDRHITRLTGQFEYARTPSLSLFAQLSGGRTSYDQPLLAGGPNLDSKALRLLGGVNFDIAGRMRGTIGIGYSVRNYDASIYKSVRGLSVESQIEVFPTDRITIGLTSERTIEDSTVDSRTPFWDTRFGLRGDYDLLANAILSATAEYSREKYIGSSFSSNAFRVTAGGRYLASRRVSLRTMFTYAQRLSNNAAVVGSEKEARIEAGISYAL